MIDDHSSRDSRSMRRRSAIRGYRCIQTALACFVVGYIPVAVAIKACGPSPGQIFPFSSWSLYTRVPNMHTDYTIMISAVGANRLEIPFDVHDAGPLGIRGNAVWAHQIIQRMGEALRSGDLGTFKGLQGNLERLQLPSGEGLEYSLIERELDPLQYMRAKTVVSERVLKTFVRDGAK